MTLSIFHANFYVEVINLWFAWLVGFDDEDDDGGLKSFNDKSSLIFMYFSPKFDNKFNIFLCPRTQTLISLPNGPRTATYLIFTQAKLHSQRVHGN